MRFLSTPMSLLFFSFIGSVLGCAGEDGLDEVWEEEVIRIDGSPTGNNVASTPGDASSATGTSSCSDLYAAITGCNASYGSCADACQSDVCTQDCQDGYQVCFDRERSRGSAQGQSLFNAVQQCQEGAYSSCHDQSSERYTGCSGNCANDACRQSCADEATAVLQECLAAACATQYSACGVSEMSGGSNQATNNQSPTPGPGSSCEELYHCEDGCNGDRNCGQTCYDQGTELARSQWTSLVQCGQIHCDTGAVVDSATYRACLQYSCADHYNTCFEPGGTQTTPQGGLTCGEGYTCIRSCYDSATSESTFNTCAQGCTGQLSSQAAGLMATLKSCIDVECMNVPGSIDNYYRCHRDYCSTQYNACLADQAASQAPGGGNPVSCLEIHEAVLQICVPAYATCTSNCNDDACQQRCSTEIETCIADQKNAAPAQAGVDFDAVLTCRDTNRDTCYDEASGQYSSCVSACASGDANCENGCATSADQTYEACFSTRCASEYGVCGIQ